MALPGLVLVHGGLHAADCWDLMVAELAREEPELRVLAVDLPGRCSRPADLSRVKITDWVNSAVADVDDAALGDVVVVGHSMAGLTVPVVVAKLGAARVRKMILLAAFVPPQGSSVVDTLRGPLAPLARSARWIHRSFPMPTAAARFAFCNGMTRQQRALVLSRLCLESPNVIVEPVADADIGAIISAVGVARGTFYFHFPTKEHVLEEVERNLVGRLASDMGRFVAAEHDVWSTMAEVVRLVLAAESRLGTKLFRDILALHFSQTRPPGFGKPTDHPLVAILAREIDQAQQRGTVHWEADALNSALFFLLGFYALLVTNHDSKPARARVLDDFVASTRRGLQAG